MKLSEGVAPLLKQTWAEFSEDDAFTLSGALSYYAMVSLVPLTLLLVAGVGFALRYWDTAVDARAEILNTVATTFGAQFRETLAQVLASVSQNAAPAGIIALVTLLVTASGVFRQLELSFNRIWDVPLPAPDQSYSDMIKSMAKQWATSFVIVGLIGLLVVASLVFSGVTSQLTSRLADVPVVGGFVGYIVGYAVALLLNMLIFALLFKYLPHTRVEWRDVLLGALITAILWELAKRGLSLYISSSSSSAYGIVGGVLVLMTWIYFSSLVLFLGAEFTQVYSQRRGSRKQAGTVPTEFQETYPPPLPSVPAASADDGAKIGAATGAGLVVGAVGGVVAAAAMLVVVARRALSFRGRR